MLHNFRCFTQVSHLSFWLSTGLRTRQRGGSNKQLLLLRTVLRKQAPWFPSLRRIVLLLVFGLNEDAWLGTNFRLLNMWRWAIFLIFIYWSTVDDIASCVDRRKQTLCRHSISYLNPSQWNVDGIATPSRPDHSTGEPSGYKLSSHLTIRPSQVHIYPVNQKQW